MKRKDLTEPKLTSNYEYIIDIILQKIKGKGEEQTLIKQMLIKHKKKSI